MDDNVSPVASAVRAELARANLSARQLADALGINRGWLHRRLAGEVSFSADDLLRIANHLKIPVSRLFGPNDAPAQAAS